MREILTFKPIGHGTNIGLALERLSRVMIRKSVVFLVSDFLGDGYEKPLRTANRKHDVIALKITDPRERSFDSVGLIELEDAESGETILVDTASSAFRSAFDYGARMREETLKRSFDSVDLDYLNIVTNEPYVLPLVRLFKRREKRR